MPSIPQSLLWISLVVLWLFVLVPMLINRRETVRRTSDIALSTRVLNGRMRARLRRRSGPATGHRHDPLWTGGSDLDDQFEEFEVEDYEEAVRTAVQEAARRGEASRRGESRSHTRTVMVVASVTESTTEPVTEPVYLDVDVVEENSGALPVGGGVQDGLFEEPSPADPVRAFKAEAAGFEATGIEDVPVGDAAVGDVDLEDEPAGAEADPVADPAPQSADDGYEDGALEDGELEDGGYEYVDDTSGLEAEEEPPVAARPGFNRRRRLDSSATAAAVTARKYRFRKRLLTALAAVMVVTAVLSFTVSSALWWTCGTSAAITVLYLAYLRRQTRIEEQVRRRRQQRMARSRGPVEEGEPVDERRVERDVETVGARLRRPGAVVLDIDDEDPVFEHLDEVRFSRRYDLPRAAGQ